MARAPRSSRAARRRAQDRLRRGSAHAAVSCDHRGGCTWAGVRERTRGRWAAQLRIPGTRARLWIGGFEQALQAALAYDAAIFCLYGTLRLPSPRRFNFPAALRPDIPEDVRAMLSRDDIKVIAESHARSLARFFLGPQPVVSPAATSPPPPPAPAAAGEATATSDSDSSNDSNYYMG